MFKECDRKRSKVKDFAKRKLIPNEQVTLLRNFLFIMLGNSLASGHKQKLMNNIFLDLWSKG